MPNAIVLTQIGTLYLAALLNALGAGALAASSGALSNTSSSVHQAFIGSIGWFGIGTLLSVAIIILHHVIGLYWGERRDGDPVQTAIPVASMMSFLLFVLGTWEAAPLFRHLGI
jgi:hypothetical protein